MVASFPVGGPCKLLFTSRTGCLKEKEVFKYGCFNILYEQENEIIIKMPPFSGINAKQETQNEAYTNKADIFEKETMEVSTDASRSVEYRPLSLESQGPFDIHIPPEGALYLNPSEIRLHGLYKVVKVVNGREVDLDETDQVAPVDYFGPSLFRTCEVDFQGKLVSYVATPNQHLKTVIENKLNYNSNCQKTHLKSLGCHPDTAGEFDRTHTNDGWRERKAKIAFSKVCDFEIDLHNDILATEKFYPDGLDVTIRLNREKDSFALIARPPKSTTDTTTDTSNTNEPATNTLTDAGQGSVAKTAKTAASDIPSKVSLGEIPDYRIKIIDLVLRLDKIQMDKTFQQSQNAKFNRGQLGHLPFCRTVIKTKSIPKGESYAKIDNLFINELPNSCIIAMIDSVAYNGDIRYNPYNLQHFMLNYLAFRVNGEIVPAGGLRPDFEENAKKNPIILREYRRLFDHIGVGMGNITNNITPELFKGGVTLFPHDFTPDRCTGYHNHKKVTGNIDLELRFAKPLEQGITVLAMGSFDDFIELDNTRNVVFRHPTVV